MSFGGGSSSKSQSWLPGSEDYLFKFKNVGSSYLNQADPTGGEFRKVGEQNLLDTAKGKYLTPDSNPYLQQTANAITRNATENVNNTLNSLSGQSQMGGTWGSNKAAQVKANAGRSMMQDVTDRMMQLFGNNYAQERKYQYASTPDVIAQGDYPEQMALQIAQMFGGMGQSTSKQSPSFALL
jgi:hypothetical protein